MVFPSLREPGHRARDQAPVPSPPGAHVLRPPGSEPRDPSGLHPGPGPLTGLPRETGTPAQTAGGGVRVHHAYFFPGRRTQHFLAAPVGQPRAVCDSSARQASLQGRRRVPTLQALPSQGSRLHDAVDEHGTHHGNHQRPVWLRGGPPRPKPRFPPPGRGGGGAPPFSPPPPHTYNILSFLKKKTRRQKSKTKHLNAPHPTI